MTSRPDNAPDKLVIRVRTGDPEALAEAFRAYRHRLGTIVQFHLDPRVARRVGAEDVLQEAYLNASKHCGHVEGDTPESLFIWLRMIVMQALGDDYRRHLGAQVRDAGREEVGYGHSGSAMTSVSLAARLVGHLRSPTMAVRRVERAERLQAASCFGQLSRAYRDLGLTQQAQAARAESELFRRRPVDATP